MPRFANAVEMLQLVVDLPMPPLPYTASVSVKGVAPKNALGECSGLCGLRCADRIINEVWGLGEIVWGINLA